MPNETLAQIKIPAELNAKIVTLILKAREDGVKVKKPSALIQLIETGLKFQKKLRPEEPNGEDG